MEKLVKVLNKVSEVSAWKISQVHTKSLELFYVLDKLETNRATDTIDYTVTIYVDKDNKRGSSEFNVYSYMNEDELIQKIEENVYAAKFALNEYYDLPSCSRVDIEESKSNLKDVSFKEMLPQIVDAVFKANAYKEGKINATEIFLYEITERIVNSKGVDVVSTSYKGNIEFIPTWIGEKEEVELYEMLRFGSLNLKEITAKVDEALLQAKARSEAKELSLNQDVSVIIEDGEVFQVFNFFKNDLSYASKYQKVNRNELEESVQGEDIIGDKITMTLVGNYQGAMNSKSVDNDGVVLHEVKIIEEGIAKVRHGSYRFGYYLKESNPTGILPIMVVNEGTKSFEEMKKTPYIRCVKFSGMQLEPRSGFIGGEVRLGYYFDGEKEIPVTGFSISGNIHELKKNLILSSDTVTLPSYHGPKYIELKGMKIA